MLKVIQVRSWFAGAAWPISRPFSPRFHFVVEIRQSAGRNIGPLVSSASSGCTVQGFDKSFSSCTTSRLRTSPTQSFLRVCYYASNVLYSLKCFLFSAVLVLSFISRLNRSFMCPAILIRLYAAEFPILFRFETSTVSFYSASLNARSLLANLISNLQLSLLLSMLVWK